MNSSGFIIQLVITLAAAVCVPVIGYFIIRMRMVAGHFQSGWKRPLRISPRDFLGMRADAFHGYRPFYRYRVFDDEIRARIFQGGHVLVEGDPLSGKTRALFEGLSRLPSYYRIAVLRPDSPDLRTFRLPLSLGFNNKRRVRIVVIDDFDRFIKKRNAQDAVELIDEEGCIIVAAGRRISSLSRIILGDLYPFFGDPIAATPVKREDAAEIVDTLFTPGGKRPPRLGRFNGALGYVCLPLEVMADRFDRLPQEERDLLVTILGLFRAGLHYGTSEFPEEVVGLHMTRREPYYGLEGLSKRYEHLEEAGFITTRRGMVTVETAYLEEIVSNGSPVLDSIKEIAAAYSRDSLILLVIAERLFSLAAEGDDRVGYLLAARDILMEALGRVRSQGPSELRRTLYNNLGAVLGGLFEVTGRFGYARQGIASLTRSLDEVHGHLSRVEYADTLSNIASLYMLLAEHGGTGYHASVARDGFYESLAIYRGSVMPLKIAEAWANAGRALTVESVVERNPAHAARALEAFLEALTTYSPRTHPFGYARILSDLGRCYLVLSRFTNRKANARRAVEAFSRSLNIRKRNRFPEEYAETRVELAGAWCVLAREDSFEEYTLKAVKAYQDAVGVYRELNRPDRCAVVCELMGDSYLSLARRKRDASLVSWSAAAYGEALKIWGEKSDPSRHAALHYRIGCAYRTLFRYNCDLFALKRAARAFGTAARIGEEQNRPASCGLAYQQLGRVLLLLAENNGGESRTKYGHEAACALNRVLDLFDAHRFSMNHRAARRSLKEAYDIVGSSKSAMVDGKRLLLGHLSEVKEARHRTESADPSAQPHTGVGGELKRSEALRQRPSDPPDIFKTGCDVRAVVRQSMTDG
ncbi:MAG: hypothetical protein JW885_14125 [Deltaproteobacteria bacterium]|nr:hypothetical protein [Candidatus Zymogenaceae bacterium]